MITLTNIRGGTYLDGIRYTSFHIYKCWMFMVNHNDNADIHNNNADINGIRYTFHIYKYWKLARRRKRLEAAILRCCCN